MEQTNDSARPAPRITVLGVGTMGAAMTRRLLANGFTLGVWDRNPQGLPALVESGAEAFSDAKEAVRHADVVLTLLPTAEAVSEVMVTAGVLSAMGAGTVWAQMGTIGLKATQQLDDEVRTRCPGVLFVDAPVSGSRAPAESGQLVILASGPGEAKAVVDPVFAALGRWTMWLGPAGFGSRMKLVLNTLLAFEVEAAAEVLALARHFGIPDEDLTDAISGSPLVSPYAGSKLEKMQAGDDSPDFSLAFALKDLTLVEEAGGAHAPVAGAIAGRWRRLAQDGWSNADVSAARHGLNAPTDALGSATP